VNEIIVGVDGSETAHAAAREGASLASNCNRPLHLVMAITDLAVRQVQRGGETWQLDPVTHAEEALAGLKQELSSGVEITSVVVADHAAAALCAEAERLGASMIVVGNKRVQGMSRLLGAVANDVVRHAPCSVLVAHTTG
jgi:nucleotide-binding universal stress UspA family protein